MEVTPYSAAVRGFSSTLSFTTTILSVCSPAISSRMGETWRHGPHHSAQKSTSTGLSCWSTSLAKLSSVTVLVFAPTGLPLWTGSVGGCPPLLVSTRPTRTGFPASGRDDGLRDVRGVAGRDGVVKGGEVPLGVQGRRAPGAGRGHRLAIDVVHDVAAGE